MVYFLNAEGALLRCVPARVHCGSAEANRIVLVAPFSESSAASAAFTLPSGEATREYLLSYEGRLEAAFCSRQNAGAANAEIGAESEGAGAENAEIGAANGGAGAENAEVGAESEGADAKNGQAHVWSLALPACVSAQSGRVRAQFYFYGAAGERVASEAAAFLVEQGVEAAQPGEEDAGAYAEVMAALAQLSGGVAGGAFAARALRAYGEGTAYGAGELVFCPAGEGHAAALLRSLTEENTAAPYAAGALDTAHWEEAFSFGEALQTFGEQLAGYAHALIRPVRQLPAAGEEDTLYALVSAQDTALFTLYAYSGGQWVALGSKSAAFLPEADAVRFTAQQLTAEQQAQARANIGAQEAADETVTSAQLEEGLSSLAAVLSAGEQPPASLCTGADVYELRFSLPEPSFTSGNANTEYDFVSSAFSSAGWSVTGGEGAVPAPSFGADGLRIEQGLLADRGAAAVSNPLYGKTGLAEDGCTVVLYLRAGGAFCNDFESIFGFSDTPDSADSAFDFFAVTSNGTGIRFNANGAGNLGETYFDITGGSVLDLSAPSLYVMTVTGSAIEIYCNGEKKARYPYTAGGANTAYRTGVLAAIAQMPYFVLGCCTARLGWGNPAMLVKRCVVCDYALTEQQVQALFAGSVYAHTVRVGSRSCAVLAARAEKLAAGEAVGSASGVYRTAEGELAAFPYLSVLESSPPVSSHSVRLGIGAEVGTGDASIALGARAEGNGGLAVGNDAQAGSYCTAVGPSASAQGSAVESAVALGHNAAATEAHSVQLGGSENSYVYYCGTLSQRSDERDKADIEEFDDEKSLRFVTSLKTFGYVRNPRGAYEYTEQERAGARTLHRMYGLAPYDKAAHAAGAKKGSRRRAGLSAQDVQAKAEAAFGCADFVNLVCDSLYDRRAAGEAIPEGVESQLEVSYLSLIPFMISALRAQQRRIAALEAAAGLGEANGAEG